MNKHRFAPVVALLGVVLLVLLGTYLPLGSGSDAKIEFKINQGDGSAKVARLLAERGVVRSRYLFIGYTILAGKEKSFKAGKYTLSRSMNIPEIVAIFSEGKAEPEGVLVTLPEGSNAWDVAAVLGQSFKNLKVADFQKYEGYIFPDTYWFGTNESEEGMIKKMRDNFDEKTKNLTLNVSNVKLREAVIIASILEKEVKTEEDMALVAGIIYKRLKIGMPLQIDATVAYGVCRPNAEVALVFDVPRLWQSPFWFTFADSAQARQVAISGLKLITFAPHTFFPNAEVESSPDLKIVPAEVVKSQFCDVTQVNLVEGIKIDGPYNTYSRKGLPSGPISNPGLKALNAALNQVSSDYLYYLSAKDGGRTIFSKTSAEHQRNRAKYLK